MKENTVEGRETLDLPFVLLCGALATVGFTGTIFRAPVMDFTISDIFLMLSLSFHIFSANYWKLLRNRFMFIIFLGTVLYCTALIYTSFFVIASVQTAFDALKIALTYGLSFFLGGTLINSSAKLLLCLRCLVIGGCIDGMAGFYELITHKVLIAHDVVRGIQSNGLEYNDWERKFGLSEHPNELGEVCGAAACVSMYKVFDYRVREICFWGGCLLISVLGLFAAASISAALSLFLATGLAIVLGRKPVFSVVGILVGTLTSMIYLAMIYSKKADNSLISRVGDIISMGGNYTTALQRKESFVLAFNDIVAHPYRGVGHLIIELPPHNELLFSWWHGGPLALFGMTLILGGFLFFYLLNYRWGTRGNLVSATFKSNYCTLGCAFGAFLVEISVAPSGFHRSAWAMTWLLAAGVFMTERVRRANAYPPKRSRESLVLEALTGGQAAAS